MKAAFNPEMLVIARESRGVTQKGLAASSGSTQGTISKAENGQLMPSEELLQIWADALGYLPSLFVRPSNPGETGLPVAFYRKQASMPAGTAKNIRANVAISRLQLATLMRSVEIPENRVPLVTLQGAQRSPCDIARELRVSWQVPRGPIINLTKLLEDNGVVVAEVEFGSRSIEGLSVYQHRGELPPLMFVSKNAPPDRLRFTVAHELGHMVLHHHLPLPPEDCEEEANEFAAELLMPDNEIRSFFSARLSLKDLIQLKLHWRVSMQALLMRASSLGRITRSHSTRLWKQISALGYRTQEPGEIPREEPSLVNELVRVHLEDLGFNEEELARILDLPLSGFLEKYRPTRHKFHLV